MKKGDKVIIIPSKELTEMKLDELCGREVIVDEVLDSENRKMKGCWVTLIGEPFEDELEWFVPLSSIV
ncbi:hypothetical protein [Bacteroides sp. 224]|uniref:hypothetical protein n=1 Tax=Bacteroides sp. 224 TaxID=2302936 RepID=UPI0013D1651B|nr:hypothetical protein [Bacteroides sp. 224]NDV63909.1 hypothetical protein [Bacteroides sp. 224]